MAWSSHLSRRWLGLFHAGTGVLLKLAVAPLLTRALAQVQAVHPALQSGDVLVADRGLCSYAHLALLVQAGVHAVLRGGAGVDHIVEVDFAGNFPVSRESLRHHGVLAVYAAGVAPHPTVPLQFQASNITVRFVLVYDMPEPAKQVAVHEIPQLLADGKVRHLAGPHFPFESVVQAHQAVEGGAIGKVVLEVGEDT